jgi:Na+/H+ antiporter NhaD/arsenite permease-like protein
MLASTFNSSIWNALWMLLPLGIAVFLVCFFSLKKGSHYFFDPKHNVDERLKDERGDYEPHSKRYQELAKLAITLSAAAIAFLISIVASDKPVAPAFAQRVQLVAPIVCGFFGACIALLVLFMVLQSVWYEEYCHSPDHSTYKRWKYALSTSLGWTGLLSFVLGFFWLARNMFRP